MVHQERLVLQVKMAIVTAQVDLVREVLPGM
jgi:hypothetical protein